MDPQEQAQKLATIAKLPAGELQGWHGFAVGWRQPFPGEIAALQSRAKSLGIVLPSSDAAPKG